MEITRENIICCYRYILGREPESEESIEAWLHFGKDRGLDALRREFLLSEEFQRSFLYNDEFYHEIQKRYRNTIKRVELSHDIPMIRKQTENLINQIIRKFDEGYRTISLIDENKDWLGAIDFIGFSQYLSRAQKLVFNNLHCDFQSDENALKRDVTNRILGTGWEEIPVVRDKKLVLMGKRLPFRSKVAWNWVQGFSELRWDLVSEDVIQKSFQKNEKILISSSSGMLSGFLEKFSFWLDIDVYDDSLTWEKMNEKYKIFLYGADLWGFLPMEKKCAKELYADLLMESVVQYLEKHNVFFHCYDIEAGPDVIDGNRTDCRENYLDSRLEPRESALHYCVLSRGVGEVVEEYDRCISSGRRITAESQTETGSCIYLFGGCIVSGTLSDASDDTIESHLQRMLDKNGFTYRVVNCGTRAFSEMATDHFLNHWYQIMDTSYRPGDMVILFTRSRKWRIPNCHIARTPFISLSGNSSKIFVDNVFSHMNNQGRKIMAGYVYDTIKDNLLTGTGKVDGTHFTYLSRETFNEVPSDIHLKNLLQDLPKHNRGESRIGALVMKADPFTIAHKKLVIDSLKECDYLYVFIIECGVEYFSLADRRQMVEKAIQDQDKNVCVLPVSSYPKDTFFWDKMLGTISYRERPNFMPVNDAYVFSRWIAPKLGITVRFSGEETYDENARRCTLLMKDFLESEGISWTIFPRIHLEDGRTINTNEIREWIKNGEMEKCREYMTEETFDYLKNRMNGQKIES